MIKFLQWFIAPLGYTIVSNSDLEMDRRINCMMQNLVAYHNTHEYLSSQEFFNIGIRWDVLEAHENVVPFNRLV